MNRFGIEGILDRLRQLDSDLLSCAVDDEKCEITIVGGSALALLGLSADSRITSDIDVIEMALMAEELLERYDMNQHAGTFLYRLPENWRTRKQRIDFDGTVLEVFAPSNEDLAILKLRAYRPVDQSDLKEMLQSGGLSIDKLLAIVNDDAEIKYSFEKEEDWREFLERTNELVAFSKITRNIG